MGRASSFHGSEPAGCQETSANPIARDTSRTTTSSQSRPSRAANRSSGTAGGFNSGRLPRGSLEAPVGAGKCDKSGQTGSRGRERPASVLLPECWLVRVDIELLYFHLSREDERA